MAVLVGLIALLSLAFIMEVGGDVPYVTGSEQINMVQV